MRDATSRRARIAKLRAKNQAAAKVEKAKGPIRKKKCPTCDALHDVGQKVASADFDLPSAHVNGGRPDGYGTLRCGQKLNLLRADAFAEPVAYAIDT